MDKQIGKLIARIAENLPDMSTTQVQGWIDKPKMLQKFLRGLCSLEAMCDFTIWRTIRLEVYKSASALETAVSQKGRLISRWASEALKKVTMSLTTTELDLVVVSVEDLGFKEGATYAQICKRAAELGLRLCPAEVGPQLCVVYITQPKDEALYIAMEPIRDDADHAGIFLVVHGTVGLGLSISCGNSESVWLGIYHFVFVRPRTP